MCSFSHGVFIAVWVGLSLVAYGEPAGLRMASNAGGRESSYETIMRLRREAAADKTPETFSVGPVVAKAKLKLVPPMRASPTGYLGLQRQDTTPVRPAGLQDVPPDAPAAPVYFVVRVGDREVPGITYRSTRSMRQVKLCLDMDGDGLLSDEREYVGARLVWIQVTASYQFGPVSTRPAANDLGRGAFYAHCSNGQWLTFHSALYRQGEAVLEGRAYKIALVDTGFDGKYNKSFVPPAENARQPGCDVLAIDLDGDSTFDFGRPGESEIMPLSQLVKVNGRYYHIEVAEDGSMVTFRRAEPAFGLLDVGNKEVVLGLWSDAAHQRLSGFGGKLRVPAGRYGLVSLESATTDSGDHWTFEMAKGGAGQLGDFEIRPGQTTTFRIGPPFQIRTSMRRSGQDVWISFDLEGQGGERYIPGAKKDGTMVPEPTFKVVDGSGQVVHSGRFKYG